MPGRPIRRLDPNDPDAKLIHSAQRLEVVSALERILPLTDARWYLLGNAYVPNASQKIYDDSNEIAQGQEQEFIDYLAGSVFTHCGDGWGFLGRALDSIIKGDIFTAVHLAYYAELRAAVSLLASEGIFVGNNQHFVITITGIEKINIHAGTHSFAWQALQAWSDGPRANSVFSEVIKPGIAPLSDWTASLPINSATAKINELFKLVSLDLIEFDKDHARRNTVSYNPSRLIPSDIDPNEIRDLLIDTWRVLEPGTSGSFPVLDRALLPELLRAVFLTQTQTTAWTNWINDLAPATEIGTVLLNDIKARNPTAPSTGIVSAMFLSDPNETDPALYLRPMLARTVFLLRIATGSAINLLTESGNNTLALKPWIDSLATSRALWPEDEPLDDPSDLWADIAPALNDIESIEFTSLYQLANILQNSGLLALSQGERVAVWNFSDSHN